MQPRTQKAIPFKGILKNHTLIHRAKHESDITMPISVTDTCGRITSMIGCRYAGFTLLLVQMKSFSIKWGHEGFKESSTCGSLCTIYAYPTRILVMHFLKEFLELREGLLYVMCRKLFLQPKLLSKICKVRAYSTWGCSSASEPENKELPWE